MTVWNSICHALPMEAHCSAGIRNTAFAIYRKIPDKLHLLTRRQSRRENQDCANSSSQQDNSGASVGDGRNFLSISSCSVVAPAVLVFFAPAVLVVLVATIAIFRMRQRGKNQGGYY